LEIAPVNTLRIPNDNAQPVPSTAVGQLDPLSPQALHAHFLAILPRIQTHAEIYFRGIKCPGKRADAIAETIAISWKWFLLVYGEPHGQEHMDAFEDRLRDNTQSPVPDQAAFRIDYPAWHSQLGHRNSKIAQDMMLECSTMELAELHKVSQGRISQLRRAFHADWQRFHGEAV
jgi:hypothetical protein